MTAYACSPLKMKLPVALGREPLVEAIFEVRFVDEPNLPDLVPGLLFAGLDTKPAVHRLPAADIPQPVRKTDPKLSHVAITRLELPDFNLLVGERNLILSCKLPYPKWPAFKREIVELMAVLAKQELQATVERYSLKFVNLVPAPTPEDQIAKVNLDLKLGELEVVNNHLNLQVHHHENGMLHILSLITGANARLSDGVEVRGVVVDVDSIIQTNPTPFVEFVEQIEQSIESLRQANKEKFFGCLKPETIQEMEPVYE